jgi:putative transposase
VGHQLTVSSCVSGVRPVHVPFGIVRSSARSGPILSTVRRLYGTLVLHADRGSSMKSKPVALLLADLGVTKSHSRPHVSNDNPYSESQFRTLKYWPSFPQRFGCSQDAREFCCRFFPWYNDEYRHSGISYLTPATVHYGGAEAAHVARTTTLQLAYAAHPERFVRGLPHPLGLPTEAWINKPSPSQEVLQ